MESKTVFYDSADNRYAYVIGETHDYVYGPYDGRYVMQGARGGETVDQLLNEVLTLASEKSLAIRAMLEISMHPEDIQRIFTGLPHADPSTILDEDRKKRTVWMEKKTQKLKNPNPCALIVESIYNIASVLRRNIELIYQLL